MKNRYYLIVRGTLLTYQFSYKHLFRRSNRSFSSITEKHISGDASAKASSFLDKAITKNYAAALNAHTKFYQNYFNGVKLDLGVTDAVNKPTDERIAAFAKANDPHLAAISSLEGTY